MVTKPQFKNILKPLIKKANIARVHRSKLLTNSAETQLISNLGGHPYIEENEGWPICRQSHKMWFVGQIFNNDKIHLPDDIKLVQLFKNPKKLPINYQQEDWYVKVYKKLDIDKCTTPEVPKKLGGHWYNKLSFKEIKTLPDWAELMLYNKEAFNIGYELGKNEQFPWSVYNEMNEKLKTTNEFCTQIGGYPYWMQSSSTPTDKNGHKMTLLFTLDSSYNADLSWGNNGILYVFYSLDTDEYKCIIQDL